MHSDHRSEFLRHLSIAFMETQKIPHRTSEILRIRLLSDRAPFPTSFKLLLIRRIFPFRIQLRAEGVDRLPQSQHPF